jgi:hypothetical protein
LADNQSPLVGHHVVPEGGTVRSPLLVPKVDRRPQLRERIREQYLRVPGQSMTLDQARQLFGLEQSTCGQLLDSLQAEGFLAVDADARYHRVAG